MAKEATSARISCSRILEKLSFLLRKSGKSRSWAIVESPLMIRERHSKRRIRYLFICILVFDPSQQISLFAETGFFYFQPFFVVGIEPFLIAAGSFLYGQQGRDPSPFSVFEDIVRQQPAGFHAITNDIGQVVVRIIVIIDRGQVTLIADGPFFGDIAFFIPDQPDKSGVMAIFDL